MVIALRMARLAGGGARSKSEACLLVPEKMEALAEAGMVAASAALAGGNSHKVTRKF